MRSVIIKSGSIKLTIQKHKHYIARLILSKEGFKDSEYVYLNQKQLIKLHAAITFAINDDDL